jgi:hypothetical protein
MRKFQHRFWILALGLCLVPPALRAADENYSFKVGSLATPTPTPTRDPGREQALTKVEGNGLRTLSSQFPQVILMHKYYGVQEEGEPSFVVIVPDLDGDLAKVGALRQVLKPLTPNVVAPPKKLNWGLHDAPGALEAKLLAYLGQEAKLVPPKARVKIIALGFSGLLAKHFLSQGAQGLLPNPAVNDLMARVDRFIAVDTPFFGLHKAGLPPALSEALRPGGLWPSQSVTETLPDNHLSVDYRLVALSSRAYTDTAGYGTGSAELGAIPAMFSAFKFRRDPNNPNRWRQDRTEVEVVEAGDEGGYTPLAMAAARGLFDKPQVTLYRLRRGKDLAPEAGGTAATLMDFTTDAKDKDSVDGFLNPWDQDPVGREMDPVGVMDYHNKLELVPASMIRLIDPSQVWGILRDFSPATLKTFEMSEPFINLLSTDPSESRRDPEGQATQGLKSCLLGPTGLFEIGHDPARPSYCEGLRFHYGINHVVFHTVNWAGMECTQGLDVLFDVGLATAWPKTPAVNTVVQGDPKNFPGLVVDATIGIGGVPTGKFENGKQAIEVRPAATYSGIKLAREDWDNPEEWGQDLSVYPASILDVKTTSLPNNQTETLLKLDLRKTGVFPGNPPKIPSGRYKVWLTYHCPYDRAQDIANDYYSFAVDNDPPKVEWVKSQEARIVYRPYLRDANKPDRLVLCYRTSDPLSPIVQNVHFVVKGAGLTTFPEDRRFESCGLYWAAFDVADLAPGSDQTLDITVFATDLGGNTSSDTIEVHLVR